MSLCKRFDRYELAAVILTVIFVLSSTTFLVYAKYLKPEPYSNSEIIPIHNIRKCLEDLKCDDINHCSSDIVRFCMGIKPPHQYKQPLRDSWFSNESCKRYLNQVAGDVMTEDYLVSEQGLLSHKRDLAEVKKAIHSGPSYVLHWYINKRRLEDDNEWKTITTFGKSNAIYTVSSGPTGASNGSAIVATEDGMYHIYAKITFSCRKVDKETKRVAMKVLLETPGDASKEILEASDTAQCYIADDFVTLYQSGHFSLQAGSKISLQYLTSTGVGISQRHHKAYKSFFGIYKAVHS